MSENQSDGFSTSGAESGQADQQESRCFHRIINLMLRLRPGMRGVACEPKFNFEKHGWNAQTLHLYSHCGTHIDAPTHSEAGDQTIDEVPLALSLAFQDSPGSSFGCWRNKRAGVRSPNRHSWNRRG